MAGKDLKLGFLMEGGGRTYVDWRHKNAVRNAGSSFEFHVRQAGYAEKGKFDFVFLADGVYVTERSAPHALNRFEPLTLLSGLAAVTRNVGLVGTVSSTYSEPFNVARQFAALDHISGGRAAFNVVTTTLQGSAQNYNGTQLMDHDNRYRLAAEHLDVVQGLWDSWEDDALVQDKATGQFFDPAKLHTLNHKGEFFQVKGPLNIIRPPQGQPMIFQAGSSEEGRNFAAKRADAIFVSVETIDDAKAYYRDVKRRAVAFGRNPDTLFILPGIKPIVGLTDGEAEALYDERASMISLKDAYGVLGKYFNEIDFTRFDPDGAFPDVFSFGTNGFLGKVTKIAEAVKKDGLSLRQVALRFATPRGDFVGTPDFIADTMKTWLENEAADGFMVGETLPLQFRRFTETVVPALQARGIFRREYEGTTLRDNFGLERPLNRFVAARMAETGQLQRSA